MKTLVFCVCAFLSAGAMQVRAQAFFADFVTDPATGVDRGSTSTIRAVEVPTTILTFSSTGSEDIGPYIGSLSFSAPGVVAAGDQIDLVGVLGGLADDGGLELTALGLGYRVALPGGFTLHANADVSDYTLGSAALLPQNITGRVINASLGLRKTWTTTGTGRLTGSLEVTGRQSEAQVFATTVEDEDLRFVRASAVHETGMPFGLRSRVAGSVTKGFDGLGASPVVNPLGSAPGATTDFLRFAFSAEASVPLSRRIAVNAGVVGQISDDVLPVSQRCGYATNAYARGFDRSYVNGDSCFGGRGEVTYTFQLPDPTTDGLRVTQGFFGVDLGTIEDNPSLFLPGNTDRWSSASMGVRTLQKDFLGEVSVTQILDKPVGVAPQDDTRVWFRAGYRF